MFSLFNFLDAHKKTLLLVLVCALFLFCLPVSVFASVTIPSSPTDVAGNTPTGGFGSGVVDVLTSVADSMFYPIALLMYGISLAIGGLIAGLGGLLLDKSFEYTVLGMGDLLTGSLGVGVQQLWAVIRDMINILFIFGLIYIGIRTILKADDSETQRKLGLLIFAALFVNFSLYITQVVVDFTNIFAVQIYNQILASNLTQTFAGGGSQFGAQSIAGAFFQIAGVTSFFGATGMTSLKLITYSIFMMSFLVILGIVCAMGAILLIARFITLIIYMIFSPLMFAGLILPAFSGGENKWTWKGFLKQAFFAPSFLLMLYLSLFVLSKLQVLLKGTAGYGDIMKGAQMDAGSITIIMFFCITIGFLYASIKVAGMMGVAGANFAMSTTQKAIGGATVGMAARAGRSTIGRGFNALSDQKWLKDSAKKSVFAKGLLQSSRYVGDSNFDARSIGVGGSSLGKARKGGYKTVSDEIVKKEKAFSESLGEIDDDDAKVKELKEHEHHLEEELEDLKREREDAPKEDKAAMDVLIKAKQDEIKAQKENIIHEKNRRQIGSYADAKYAESTSVEYDAVTKKRKEAETSMREAMKERQAEEKKLGDVVTSAEKKLKDTVDEANVKLKEVTVDTELVIQDPNITPAAKNAAKENLVRARQAQKDSTARAKAESEQVISEAKQNAKTNINIAKENIKATSKTIKEQNKKIKELRKKAQKEAPDQGYAGGLENSNFVKSAVFARSTSQDHAAGKAIRKQYEKGRMKEEAHKHEKDDHGDDHSSGAAHSAPKPSAAKPAGGGGDHAEAVGAHH